MRPHTHNKSSFLQKFWNEAEPLVIHIAIVLLVEFALLLVGLAALSLETLLPHLSWYFILIEYIDISVALVLLCVYGLYTLLRIIIMLTVNIVEEVVGGADLVRKSASKISGKRGQQRKSKDVAK